MSTWRLDQRIWAKNNHHISFITEKQGKHVDYSEEGFGYRRRQTQLQCAVSEKTWKTCIICTILGRNELCIWQGKWIQTSKWKLLRSNVGSVNPLTLHHPGMKKGAACGRKLEATNHWYNALSAWTVPIHDWLWTWESNDMVKNQNRDSKRDRESCCWGVSGKGARRRDADR